METAYPQINEIFLDVASGKTLNRPQFQLMLKQIRPGDFLYVESFSRLSRSTMELFQLLEEFRKTNITLVSHKESFDYSTSTGKFMTNLMGVMVEFERDISRERQREGIELVKKAGKYKGRQRIKLPINFQELINKHFNSSMFEKYGAEECRKELKLKSGTFYKLLRLEKEKRLKELKELKESKSESIGKGSGTLNDLF